MAPKNKRPLDDTVDHWNDNPIQEESDLIFNRPFNNPDDTDQGTEKQRTKEDSQEAKREAERKEWEAAENKFGYRKPGDQQPNSPRSGFGGLLNKKNAIRSGVAGGVIGIMLTIFGFLGPLKIPSIMQAIADEAGQRVEQVTIHRAKVIMARAILSKFGSSKSVVITGDGPVSSLIASLRTNNFEKKIFNAKGLYFEEVNGGVRLKMNGDDMGVFKNPDAILEALDGRLATKKIIDDVVKEQIPSWRWMKRAKFAKWLRIEYGVRRFGIPKSDEKDKETKLKEMEKARVTEGYERSATNLTEALNCLSDGVSCPIGDSKNEQKSNLSGGDASESEVVDSVRSSGAELADEAGDSAAKGIAKEGVELSAKLSTRIAKKAIPIVGWIDLAALINHVARVAITAADDDVITKVPAYFRAKSDAQLYADWQGYSDQIKDGSMDTDFTGVLSQQMDGAEKARAYVCIGENRGPGSVLASIVGTASAAAANSNCENSGIPIKNKINENNPSELKQTLTKLNDTLGFNAPALFKNSPSSIALEAWYNVSNKITDTITDIALQPLMLELKLLNVFVSFATGVNVNQEVSDWVEKVVTKFMNSMLSYFGLNADPLSIGPDLINYTHAGATASYNSFCKSMGCREMTVKQTSVQNQSIALERAQAIADKGWLYATFSPDATHSLTNSLAAALPTALTPQNFNATESTTALASIVATAPSRLVSGLMTKSNAATGRYVDLYGVTPYGATAADLAQPLAEQAVSGDECPEVAEGDYNGCTIDKNVAEAMECNFDPDNSNCNFTTGGVGGELNVMSYNILGAGHTNTGGLSVKDRLNNVLKTVRDRSPDIMGFQEVNGNNNQQDQLHNDLDDTYDGYPYSGKGVERPIYWKKDKFTMVDKGIYTYPRYDEIDDYPWVKLQATTGKTIYVFNTHNAAGDKDHEKTIGGLTSPEERKVAAKAQLAAVKQHVTDGSPVIMTGDYNSDCHTRGSDAPLKTDDLPCSIFKAGGFSDAGETAQLQGLPTINFEYGTTHERAGGNFNKSKNHIDHVFFNNGTTVTSWENILSDETRDGSDHSPIFVGLTVPGLLADDATDGGAVTASGFAWPLGEADWKKNQANYLRTHGSGTGTAWGADNMGTSYVKGIADDIGVGTRTPQVYAMYDGTVTSTNLCGANDGVAIKSTVNGKTFGIAYMHGTNKKVKVGQTVKAGQPIMNAGRLGCHATGNHLHLGMAYDGKYICPQDVFIGMDGGGSIDLAALTKKANVGCGGRSAN